MDKPHGLLFKTGRNLYLESTILREAYLHYCRFVILIVKGIFSDEKFTVCIVVLLEECVRQGKSMLI